MSTSFFAIHNPGGSGRKTWCKESDNPPDKDFWLWDVLPTEFPHCAVYSIAYNDPKWSGYGPAQEVVDSIRKHFRKTPLVERAPVVFIAYGIGGLYLMEVRILVH